MRGELVDIERGVPAAHAVVRVRGPEETAHHGLADAAGRFAVLFPRPRPRAIITVEVFSEPVALVALPGTALPEHRAVLGQLGAAPVLVLDGLRPAWRHELVVRSPGRSELLTKAA